MNTQFDTTQDNKSHSVENKVSQKQSGIDSTFQFIDNRQESIIQRKLNEMANDRKTSKQTIQMKPMVSNPSKITNVFQLASANRITNLLGGIKGDRGRQIVDDFTNESNKLNKFKNITDEDFSKDDLEQLAISFMYIPEYAKRLADNNPFKKDEFKEHSNTTINGNLVTIETFKQFNTNSEIHNLGFNNTYDKSDRSVEMQQNFRNPYLADFFANEVNQFQYVEFKKHYEAGRSYMIRDPEGDNPTPNISKIIRHLIVSDSGKEWKDKHFGKAAKNIKKSLSEAEFNEFLTKTVNGLSSLVFADDHDLIVVSGEITINNDGDFDVALNLGREDFPISDTKMPSNNEGKAK